jgi:uncharacterized protein YuzE
MRVRINRDADAVYFNLTGRRITKSEEVADGIVVAYDEPGRIVGIEVLDASKRTNDPGVLKRYKIDAGPNALAPATPE